ncbi:hypothetical protein LCGC14_1801330 [marine sediment metagenome]|uniref:4-oxalocrotonate tautomerase-like domain-containing protein n=1 Tax=marine sediment metagenome TaxID=412755 RepID=A0A0F9JP93_9ZZZZ
MPHVIVKLFPGRTDQQKNEFTQRIVKAVRDTMDTEEWAVSITFEEVTQEQWEEKVYKPDIIAKEKLLYKKPGYEVSNGEYKRL